MVKLNLPEKVETDRLVLARVRYEDAEEIFYSYASKPEATRYLAFPTHQSVQDARGFLSYAVAAWDKGIEFVFGIRLKADGQFVGTIGIINENGKAHFGYSISPLYWNKGLATEACKAILELLKKEKSIHRIWTFTDADNVASGKVLLKCGLAEEARLTKWFRFINQDNKPKDCVLYILKE